MVKQCPTLVLNKDIPSLPYYLASNTSTVKYTTPLFFIDLNESDPKLYTNFKFCEGEKHKHFITH